MADPEWARVVVYPATEEAALEALEDARGSDLLIKASGVGVFDELLERSILDLKTTETLVAFLDVDAPATLDRLEANAADPFHALVPRYDFILTYGGGPPVVEAYTRAGAQECVPIYNALDPHTHFPARPDARFAADFAFLGNRMPDREARVEEFFLKPAAEMPDQTFLLGGNGWADKPVPANVRRLGHVYTREHNAFNSTPVAVLNINRSSMARYGFSPATRVFEAAGAAACLLTDAWAGIELFLEPGQEVLVAQNGHEVVEQLRRLSPERAHKIGQAGYRRVLNEHTYAHRADQLEKLLEGHVRPAVLE